jgi:hypothetical protein
MATQTSQRSHIGEGKVFLGLVSGGGIRPTGQHAKVELKIREKKETLENYEGGGGVADEVSMIESVTLEMEFASFSPENLALAMRGVVSDVAATTVASQDHTAYSGCLLPLGFAPTGVTITVNPSTWVASTTYTVGQIVKPTAGANFYKCKVAGTSSGAEPTWKTDGTDTSDGATLKWSDMGTKQLSDSDFQVESVGVTIQPSCTKIAATGTPVSCSFTTSAHTAIETLMEEMNQEEYRVIFSGTNFATQGSPLEFEMYRVKFSPADGMPFITKGFGKYSLHGSVLKDENRPPGMSQFGTIRFS